jgi:superfamily II DNA or RNA helicase
VGLGKTLMATALAKIFEEDQGVSTLIICPKNLVRMWQGYVEQYGLRAKVMSSSVAIQQLPEVPARFRLVLIDESHNLRNREGKRYRAIREYIEQSDSRCILLSATLYNKSYLDLSAQLRLFVPEDRQLGMRPERLLREIDPVEFSRFQVAPNTLAAFEKSPFADDWRELMRLFLVRRTRSFIQTHYAETDPTNERNYLRLEDGSLAYFPKRIPKTLTFSIDEKDATDRYARLYSDDVVDVVNGLSLPRYGLGNYLKTGADTLADANEKKLLENLSRAGKRLLGYCRTNLFKRLESSGQAFVQSLDRHILRNYIFIYALEEGLPLPIGTQDAEMLDPGNNDIDAEEVQFTFDEDDAGEVVEGETEAPEAPASLLPQVVTANSYKARAKQAYQLYQTQYRRRFKWLRSTLFRPALKKQLREDAEQLIGVLNQSGGWNSEQDRKLDRLYRLLTRDHPTEKVLIFSQFADTVHYLTAELTRRSVKNLAGVTGQSADPTALAWRFSPVSNGKSILAEEELQVLIATDVLSEGQNLQDAAIVVNYDLPWAIIRLIQRVGRVDRIGQKAVEINCYSFLPAEGVERIIRLRARVTQRLRENGEVLGTDEQFFTDQQQAQDLRNLYTEKSDLLDEDPTETEVDLNSQAYAIWNEATKDHPALARKIEAMPDVVFSSRALEPTHEGPAGVLVYMRTTDGADALAWVDKQGQSVTQSQLAVLRAAACNPDTPTLPRQPEHHELVQQAVVQMINDEQMAGGQLGPRTGARHKTYTRLRAYYNDLKVRAPLFASAELEKAIDAIYKYPLREVAKDILNRQMKAGISDEDLARLVINLRNEDRLSIIADEGERVDAEAKIICSMGLVG